MATATRPFYTLWCSLRNRHCADVLGVAALLVLLGIASSPLLVDGTAVGLDTTTFFYPMYRLLGERLRAGDIPGWNPSLFSGAPFAADPESGWTYAPAMLLFTVLPVWLAVGRASCRER